MNQWLAHSRFGLGPKSNQRVTSTELLAQIQRPLDLPLHALTPTTEAMQTAIAYQRADRLSRKELKATIREQFQQDCLFFLDKLVACKTGFTARWMLFWLNHFTISVKRKEVMPVAFPFLRDAVAPNLFGSFETLLKATASHPAMLLYLDNTKSVGPNSRAGKRRGKGANENLAREILELHTLGVSNYTQADVIALSLMLTGWTLARDEEANLLSSVRFSDRAHEPGTQTLLNTPFPNTKKEQASSALSFLATHPSTAAHIARRLSASFLGHQNEAVIAALTHTFISTKGNLTALAETLLTEEQSWSAHSPPFADPTLWTISAARAIGPTDPQLLLKIVTDLGQAPFFASSPQGWPTHWRSWATPVAMLARVQAAVALTAPHATNAIALAETFGNDHSGRLVRSLSTLDDELAPIAFLLSPEFLWR